MLALIPLADLKETLANMFPDKHKQEEAVQRIQHTKSTSTARHKQNSTDELVSLKATMNELPNLFRAGLSSNPSKGVTHPLPPNWDLAQSR